MTIDWMAITNLGFPVFFGVFTMWIISKYGPEFIKAWNAFAVAIHKLTESVDNNTSVTRKQYEESLSVKELLRILNEKLVSRDVRFDKLTTDHEEIMKMSREDRVETRKQLDELNGKVNQILERK